jgi:hypothetical protein
MRAGTGQAWPNLGRASGLLIFAMLLFSSQLALAGARCVKLGSCRLVVAAGAFGGRRGIRAHDRSGGAANDPRQHARQRPAVLDVSCW